MSETAGVQLSSSNPRLPCILRPPPTYRVVCEPSYRADHRLQQRPPHGRLVEVNQVTTAIWIWNRDEIGSFGCPSRGRLQRPDVRVCNSPCPRRSTLLTAKGLSDLAIVLKSADLSISGGREDFGPHSIRSLLRCFYDDDYAIHLDFPFVGLTQCMGGLFPWCRAPPP